MESETRHATPGDVICVHRIGFEHFGIYAGDNRVIHYDIDPSENFKILIHEASIEEFLNGMEIYYTCCRCPRDEHALSHLCPVYMCTAIAVDVSYGG